MAPEDVSAALKERGLSYRELERRHGYAYSALCQVPHRPWPKGEQILAEALGMRAEDIWPSRYQRRARRAQELADIRAERNRLRAVK